MAGVATPKRSVRMLITAALVGTAVAMWSGVADTESTAARSRHAASAAAVTTRLSVSRRAHVLFYGDSLGWESQGPFIDAITRTGDAEVRTGVFGGTAICDWFDQMRTDAEWHPDAVVVEFSGNALTPCMQGLASGTEEYFVKYKEDATAVLTIFPDAPVYFVGTPITRRAAAAHDGNTDRLDSLYAALPYQHASARFVPAQDAVLAHGLYTETLPCLWTEPCAGAAGMPGALVNVVRAPDGGHFCPQPTRPAVNGVTAACPVWSSGAYRFGLAMAAPVIADLSL